MWSVSSQHSTSLSLCLDGISVSVWSVEIAPSGESHIIIEVLLLRCVYVEHCYFYRAHVLELIFKKTSQLGKKDYSHCYFLTGRVLPPPL